MYRFRFISIVLLVVLAAAFAIEAPFTQINYMHLFLNKKDRSITRAPKDTHRLHKTYYQAPDKIGLAAAFIRMTAPAIRPVTPSADHTPRHRPGKHIQVPNILRGPPTVS